MDEIILKCWMYDDRPEEGQWTRLVTFPVFPYPGLCVGGHVVKRVAVCQGNLDGAGEVYVQFNRTLAEPALLLEKGWVWE